MAAPLRDWIVRLGHASRRIVGVLVAAGLVGILVRLFLDINSPLVQILFAASITIFVVWGWRKAKLCWVFFLFFFLTENFQT